MKNLVPNARPMTTASTPVRAASAALALVITLSLFSSVISISEPQRSELMAQIHNADVVGAARTMRQLAMVGSGPSSAGKERAALHVAARP